MSWYYSINGGDYESSTDESLGSFIQKLADSLESNSWLLITSLKLHFADSLNDGYELPTLEAERLLDRLLIGKAEDEADDARFGTYHSQVAATHRFTTRA